MRRSGADSVGPAVPTGYRQYPIGPRAAGSPSVGAQQASLMEDRFSNLAVRPADKAPLGQHSRGRQPPRNRIIPKSALAAGTVAKSLLMRTAGKEYPQLLLSSGDNLMHVSAPGHSCATLPIEAFEAHESIRDECHCSPNIHTSRRSI